MSTCDAGNNTNACQLYVYDCLDPAATDFGSSSACNVSAPSWIGDAYCDAGSVGYNTEVCAWDGGDCCESTCLEEVTFYDCGHVAYACADPDAIENNRTIPEGCEIAFMSWLMDGYCDEAGENYNTMACGWDMGDCCESTCADGSIHSCGTSQYFCRDPSAVDYENLFCSADYPSYISDGYCDSEGGYNTKECDWDGGDCCAATCGNNLTTSFACGTIGYRCLDPDVDEGACPGNETVYYGDGFCDMWNFNLHLHLNVAVCNWDGGDCCPSTCATSSGEDCSNVVYECLDESADDYNTTSECIVDSPSWIADAYCDSSSTSMYNTAVCNWDGGDCCEDTCLDEAQSYECGQVVYVCRDPSSSGYMDMGDCEVDNQDWIADGYCDIGEGYDGYNTEACMWDGGDCCSSTCEDGAYACGTNGYDCLDPDSGDVLCPAEHQSYIADGYCDGNEIAYNTRDCNWDGGDCCEVTCQSSIYACGSSPVRYDCQDPDANSCQADVLSYVGDGYCDAIDGGYNVASCNWDGGDCCYATCEDSLFSCGTIGFQCNDPDATDYRVCYGLNSTHSCLCFSCNCAVIAPASPAGSLCGAHLVRVSLFANCRCKSLCSSQLGQWRM